MTKSVEKVWGHELWIVNNDDYCGKILVLKEGYCCSLHYHKIKDETFYLLSGQVFMELGSESFVMNPEDTVHIPIGTHHRFTGLEDSRIIEFSTHHEDDDSYRLEPSGKSKR